MSDFEELTQADERFALELRARLEQAGELAPRIRSRLAASRARALEAASPRRSGPLVAAAGNIAAVVVLAVLVLLPPREGADIQARDAIGVLTDELEQRFCEDPDREEFRQLSPEQRQQLDCPD